MTASEDQEDRRSAADRSADRRTHLARERTQLAWWRTGLTALAVAIGIGRVVPELQEGHSTKWPYVVLGCGFAIYGIALFLLGTARHREEQIASGEAPARNVAALALALTGPVLGLATIVLITLD